MFKTLTVSILAGSLAFGSAATPAMADRAETIRTIAGIAALFAIGKAISDAKAKDKNDHAYVPPAPKPDWKDKGRHDGNRWDDHRDDHRWGDRDGKHDDKRDWDRRVALPGYCAFDINGHSGRTTVVGKDCLERSRVSTRRMPGNCEFTIRGKYGRQEVYGARCLAQNGYRVEARR